MARNRNDPDLIRLPSDREIKVDMERLARVEEIATWMGWTTAQVAMAWCLSKKEVYPVVGLNSVERM